VAIDVRPSQKADVQESSRVLARAFYDDPIFMWMLPDATARTKRMPWAFSAITRRHFLRRGAPEVAVRDQVIGGATLWDPPGQWKSTRLEQLLLMPGFLWIFRGRVSVMQEVQATMEKHHPEEPAWYLMVIGSDPSVRGAGFGQALMHSRLDRCDQEHAPAYLEASKAELVPYYTRFGFEVTGEIELPNGGPKMWPMWRAAR
jgi:GNAT superfamily N-acetyltransferase